MATLLVQSGIANTAPISVTVNATAETADLLLPSDFAAILLAFKTALGIDTAVDEFISELTANRTIMVEMVQTGLQHDQPFRPLVFDFHILKIRSQESRGSAVSTESARYTVHRLLRLLAINGNLQNHAGIVKLQSLDVLSGQAYTSQFDYEHGDQLDGALLTATYIASIPHLISLQ